MSLPNAQAIRDADRALAKRIAQNILQRIEDGERVRRPGHTEIAFNLFPEFAEPWEGVKYPCAGLLELVAEEVNKVTKPLGYYEFYFKWDPREAKPVIEAHLPIRPLKSP